MDIFLNLSPFFERKNEEEKGRKKKRREMRACTTLRPLDSFQDTRDT
jgi:hypothetical protein